MTFKDDGKEKQTEVVSIVLSVSDLCLRFDVVQI